MKHNFNVYTASHITNFRAPYDCDNVMRYSAYEFWKNNLKTIVQKISHLLELFLLKFVGSVVGFAVHH